MFKANSEALKCSFCGKSEHEVKKLIAGNKVYICNECIKCCSETIKKQDYTK